MSGVLYGLGLGPGDPELVTVKAAAILGAAPVIAYVRPLRNGAATPSFARAIAAPYLSGGQEEIPIPIAMLDDPAPGRAAYDEAARTIAGHLDEGRDVAVLCEGDPLLFGSFMYILERLRDRHEVVTVPGVSSLGAAAAAAALPVVSRHQSLALIPATLGEAALASRLAATDAAAFFKVGRHLDKVKRVVAAAGRMDEAHYIERASLPEARTLPLAEAPPDAPYFSMILLTRTEA